MVTEFLLSIGAGIAEWFLSLFGTAAPPEWLTTVGGFFGDLVGRVAGLGAWVPFGMLGVVAAAVLGLWIVFWIVKGIRWLWGLTPLSGGS